MRFLRRGTRRARIASPQTPPLGEVSLPQTPSKGLICEDRFGCPGTFTLGFSKRLLNLDLDVFSDFFPLRTLRLLRALCVKKPLNSAP